MQKNIIIAEDHPLFRNALKMVISKLPENVVCNEADSIANLQAILENGKNPDLILLDLNMPGAHGFSGLHFIKGQYPKCPVVVISAKDDTNTMLEAMKIGANGYIPKSSGIEILTNAINDINQGKKWFTPETITAFSQENQPHKPNKVEKGIASLTPQQFRILGMIAEGLLNKQIGYELHISEATVKAHITAIFKKINVRNRTQAVIALKKLEIED